MNPGFSARIWTGRRRGAALFFCAWSALAPASVLPRDAWAGERCPERPPCTGCGCKGGPGYRGPDGRCVGFKNLERVCGNPPETRCTFENAPGTGANRDCARGTGDAAPPGGGTKTPGASP